MNAIAERADRRQTHDHADNHEQRVRQLIDRRHEQPGAIALREQRDADEQRHDQHLQNVAAYEPVEYGGRDDVEQKVDRVGWRAGSGGRRRSRGINVQPRARLENVDDNEADDERECGDGLEVHESANPNPADIAHGAHARNADRDRGEHDRADQHLD